MPTPTPDRSRPRARRTSRPLLAVRPRRSRRREGEGGQALVEFSLVLAPLLLLLLGIIQFGFVFNTYVTISTAAREAARSGSIYVYDRTLTRSANDLARNNEIKTQLLASLNGLIKTAPNMANSTSWTTTTSGTTSTFTNGDIVVTYVQPTTVTANDPRQGYRVTIRMTYHQDLFLPIVSNFLPKDGNGRLPLGAEVTMVIN